VQLRPEPAAVQFGDVALTSTAVVTIGVVGLPPCA
jgi:hypothetical protein